MYVIITTTKPLGRMKVKTAVVVRLTPDQTAVTVTCISASNDIGDADMRNAH